MLLSRVRPVVGIGCPGQENGVANPHACLPLVHLGVAAAFEVHAWMARPTPSFVLRLSAKAA